MRKMSVFLLFLMLRTVGNITTSSAFPGNKDIFPALNMKYSKTSGISFLIRKPLLSKRKGKVWQLR